MSILLFKDTRVAVQGITGRAARHHTENMISYGTRIVAGVRPGAAGEEVNGVPVYDSMDDACRHGDIDASILFIPAKGVKDAALQALRAGIKLVVIVSEHVPLHDAMAVMEEKDKQGAVVIGPNTPGMISPPERSILGFVPTRYFRPGPMGVLSRSGTLTYELVSRLTAAGIGQSTCIGVGGDRMVGLRFKDALRHFETDDETKAVLIIGEIGGTMEEEAAELVEAGGFTKPLVAYLAGRTAAEGTKLGHAGAIIDGGRGTIGSKVEALTRAGAMIADYPAQAIEMAAEALHG